MGRPALTNGSARSLDMRLIQTLGNIAGFRSMDGNAARWRVLERLLRIATENEAELLVLPGGFLSTEADSGVEPLANRIRRAALAAGVVVVGGIDLVAASESRKSQRHTGTKGGATDDELTARGELRYFGFVVGGSDGPRYWRQTNTSSGNAEATPVGVRPGAERTVSLGQYSIALFICGELFSPYARDGIGSTSPHLFVDCGHSGMGCGLLPAMQIVANLSGRPIVHSQHVAGLGRQSLHFVSGLGTVKSQSIDWSQVEEDGDFQVAWRLRAL